MVEGNFDRWTLAYMNAALDEACRKTPQGEKHAVRKRIAKQIIKCARDGGTTLGQLTEAGERARAAIAAGGDTKDSHAPLMQIGSGVASSA